MPYCRMLPANLRATRANRIFCNERIRAETEEAHRFLGPAYSLKLPFAGTQLAWEETSQSKRHFPLETKDAS